MITLYNARGNTTPCTTSRGSRPNPPHGTCSAATHQNIRYRWACMGVSEPLSQVSFISVSEWPGGVTKQATAGPDKLGIVSI
ncbi:hypothetical protein E2C01_069620 [Portunus trituberculatus]|uniref:Uncharacterized protein n=1 Tax=Portunus trituberculatus TaxID=210409 RepID=A0A5B7HZV6_PORTR|nr:hypothetical protein [Portunus trituberculatus]